MEQRQTQMVRRFLVFTYIWHEDVAKIPKVPLARRNEIRPGQYHD